jgi:hypothetical protein
MNRNSHNFDRERRVEMVNGTALNFSRHFDQTNKWSVMNSDQANERLQEGRKVYCDSMVKVRLTESFRLCHQLQGHREPERLREEEQNGSTQRRSLLYFYVIVN